jgi:hypothetical protein
LQVLGRPRLHTRRYFLGQQFEQKIGHWRKREMLRRAPA